MCSKHNVLTEEDMHSFQVEPNLWVPIRKYCDEKAVNRFTEMLKHSATKLAVTSLTKQLRLMYNLFNQYFAKVPMKKWEKLFTILQDQETTLRNSILNEEGPIKKENAECALNSLLSALEDYNVQTKSKAA